MKCLGSIEMAFKLMFADYIEKFSFHLQRDIWNKRTAKVITKKKNFLVVFATSLQRMYAINGWKTNEKESTGREHILHIKTKSKSRGKSKSKMQKQSHPQYENVTEKPSIIQSAFKYEKDISKNM